MTKCQVCKQNESSIRFGREPLCLSCYNDELAEQLGVAATSYPERVTLKDGQGTVHDFRLRKRLDPIAIVMDAEEECEDGCRFREYGDVDDDQGELLLRLLAKIENGMSEIYIEEEAFPNGQTYHSLPSDRLAGRIEPNRIDPNIPLLVVNGKSYTWEQMGRMLMHYEGFQVKLEVVDISEEIKWGK